MDVAVVIPLFNGASWIQKTLDCVLAQAQPPREITIVDDGSTDGSLRIVEGCSEVTLLRNPEKGANSARNLGVKHTRSPLIAFLDQDDLWHPYHLKFLADILESHPKCPAAVASVRAFHSNSQLHFRRMSPSAGALKPWELFPFNQIETPSAVMMRRRRLESCGLWRIEFPYTADHHLWLRLSASQPLVKSLPVTVWRRLHNESWSIGGRRRQASDYLTEMRLASRKALSLHRTLPSEERASLESRLAILDALACLLRALNSSAEDGLVQSAAALEDRFAGESPKLVQSACELLFWFLEASWREPNAEQILEALLDRWPLRARRTHTAIIRTAKQAVPCRVFAALALNRPATLKRWAYLGDVLRLRLWRRLHQAA